MLSGWGIHNWHRKLTDLMGSYGKLFDDNLGQNSRLRLDRGVNSVAVGHAAFTPPYVE